MTMTYEEAKKKAEEIVYCDLTLGCILYDCEKRGIPTYDKKGKQISRCILEQKLIDAMAKEMSGGDDK